MSKVHSSYLKCDRIKQENAAALLLRIINTEVASFYGMTVEKMNDPGRGRFSVCFPRQVAMALSCEYVHPTTVERFYSKSYGVARCAVKTIRNFTETQPGVRADYQRLRDLVRSAISTQ